MSFDIVNSNNEPWTLRRYLGGLRYESGKVGMRNPEFEQDVRRTIPGIKGRALSKSRSELMQMSRLPGIKTDDKIAFRDFVHLPFCDTKPYLWRGEETLNPEISERVEKFRKFYSLSSLDYQGGASHDYGHVVAGFKPNDRGEAQQIVFDINFQHMLRGIMANETLAHSLQSSFKLVKHASYYMSLINDGNKMDREKSMLRMSNGYRTCPIISTLDKELKRTDKLREQVRKVFFNEWTFPDGHNPKLVEKSLKDIRKFLEKRELLANSDQIPFYDSLQKHWLKDEEIEDITNYAQYCALKCMANLSVLSPEEKNKTIQQVMDDNGYFNMKLLERSTGLGTDNELKLPTYEEWCKMPHKNPDIDINYNSRMIEAIQSIKAKRSFPKHP